MVILRKRNRGGLDSTQVPSVEDVSVSEKKPGLTEYELAREKRIKENMLRLQSLGISDICFQMRSMVKSPKPKRRSISEKKTPKIDGVVRRSLRLKNVAPVKYVEVSERPFRNGIVYEYGKPEVYTEEHEKLLGSCKSEWDLFQDGYDSKGNRIYDPVKGKTCHQCRQKTLGHRTHCSKCKIVQGQFCGDCLYTRYGEHVLEAIQNPNWICPVCRGICNCSLCRVKRGWLPTDTLYRKVMKLGFKSVAHYLIQTRRKDNLSKDDPVNESAPHDETTIVSLKRRKN